MVVVSYSGKEINAKLVYYGAGLSGKTTNLESIYEAVPDTSRGKMVSMKTQSDRTLFFDLLPLDLGEIMGFKTRFLLYTVPGQVFYNATRKLVLKGADAIVFVADSEVGKMDENQESLANLKANLTEYGLRLDETPWVIQYNKRDLPRVYTVEELNAVLNPGGSVPHFEAVATQGTGVFETFRGISHLLMEKVTRELRRAPMSPGQGRAPKVEASAAPVESPSSSVLGLPAPATASGALEEAQAPVAGLETQAPFHFGRELTLPESTRASDDGSRDHAGSAGRSGASGRATAGPRDAHGPSIGRGSDPVTAVSTAQASSPERPAMMPPSRGDAAEPLVQDSAGAGAPQELVVPVRLSPGGTNEIVLRIIISTR